MKDTSRFKNQDLVLKVTKNIDLGKFNFDYYEPFLDALCRDREYQKEAIRTVANYLFGGAYDNLRALAEENYASNGVLQEKYHSFAAFEKVLELPGQLSCSVDLATGTGKSYVIYGLARIALASGCVDRVLILCPSNTIEAGLMDKFAVLAKDATYTDLLPETSTVRTPHVVNGTATTTAGCICIENIHATYIRTKSSIEDSFKGKGERTLVLNDEVHHVYSPEEAKLKEWKRFLISEEFGFRYIVGLSGTCYTDNEYFTDVVARYSLKQATDDAVVKLIDYVAEDATGDANERLQLIYDNHSEAKKKYKAVRPLTVIVTADIPTCKRETDRLVEFIAEREGLSREDAAKKVLRVHSRRSSGAGAKEDAEIPKSLLRLRSGEPDERTSAIEWITSVSMLTEGWDVKNVFQIVPHVERAFGSKLLIAQVLGRGLRIPSQYASEQPVVKVFNHDSWSVNIRHLVNEVLEKDRRVTSAVMPSKSKYDFDILNVDYEKAEDVVEVKKTSDYNFDMDHVNLVAQSKLLDRNTVYERALSGKQTTKKTRITLQMVSTDQLVADVHNKFKAIDLETGSNYAKRYAKSKLRRLVRNSLDLIGYAGDEVSKENRQRILSAFGNLRRPGSKSIRYAITATNLMAMRASERPRDSMGTAVLRRGGGPAVFYDDESKKADEETRLILNEIESDEHLPSSSKYKVQNSFNFKTCQSLVLTASDPERRFVKTLVEPEMATRIFAWIKSTDVGFYEIEYSYSRGDYSKRGVFNPDFFIALSEGSQILVVETKPDSEVGEPSSENKGKRRAAVEHFARVNRLQDRQTYHITFVTPKDYDMLFTYMRQGKAMNFVSNLDAALEA